ncbi:MAG: hypothetical protein QE265_12360 [Rhodoferax sp.]|nr:hypothetical protein [Rhodoferax sp.]
MSLDNHSAVMESLKTSLAEFVPARVVTRTLIVPTQAKSDDLKKGVFCLVVEGGGDFADYVGRAADLGEMNVRVVGFVQVAENATPADVETAELAMLGDLLRWVNVGGVPGLDTVSAGNWICSKQLEHPFGWLVVGADPILTTCAD